MSDKLKNPDLFVFVDECGFNTSLTRFYGRAYSHMRATGECPRSRGENHTLICAVQTTGVTAPMIITGFVDGDVFEVYVRDVLCPELEKGQIVVMDNLSAHHRSNIRMLIEQKGCQLLFLPSYSPDFNPIEMMFSKIKARMRFSQFRESSKLIEGIWEALSMVSIKDIFGWLKHCYPDTPLVSL